MNPLKELIHILEQNKSTYLQSWLFQNNNTNLVKLYYGMLHDTFLDDDAASVALYGKAGAPAFHKLKFDLKTQLYDAIPFIDVKLKNKNDAETERFRCHNLLMSFNVLIHLRAMRQLSRWASIFMRIASSMVLQIWRTLRQNAFWVRLVLKKWRFTAQK